MTWMNESDIYVAKERCRDPVVRKAILFLEQFVDQVNDVSDGWAYWQPPIRAAKRLMQLIQEGNTNEENYKVAYAQIKAFYTRRGYKAGMKFPTVAV